MDKVKRYQEIIEQMLEAYATEMSKGQNTPENQVIAGRKRNHFQLFTIGWENDQYIQFPVFILIYGMAKFGYR